MVGVLLTSLSSCPESSSPSLYLSSPRPSSQGWLRRPHLHTFSDSFSELKFSLSWHLSMEMLSCLRPPQSLLFTAMCLQSWVPSFWCLRGNVQLTKPGHCGAIRPFCDIHFCWGPADHSLCVPSHPFWQRELRTRGLLARSNSLPW